MHEMNEWEAPNGSYQERCCWENATLSCEIR